MKNSTSEKNKIKLDVSVNTTDIDTALLKVERLCTLLKEANSLIKELAPSETALKIDI